MKLSDPFLLKGTSDRNASRCAAISENDLSLIVSLNHPSGLSGEQYVDKADCPEAIFRVMHPESEA